MSELKAITAYDAYWKATSNGDNSIPVYLKSEADKVIEEKDKEIAELKQKLENVQASMYADVVDANMENRRLKRALWIARAERAKTEHLSKIMYSTIFRDFIEKWVNIERKCRAKAEEYK